MKNFIVLMILFLASSPTNSAEQKAIEQNATKESIGPKKGKLDEVIRDLIARSNTITDNQRRELLELHEKLSADRASLKLEIRKSKVALLRTALVAEMNEHEFSLLKKKIIALEKKRMENGLRSISEIRKIIAPQKNIATREFYKSFLSYHLQEL
ncbi:MAG: hypothetical protein ACXVLQ_05050 [Bacteriovorax sp.]